MKKNNHVKQSRGLKRVLFVAAGSVFLVLGVIGIVLPLLPTTPLLLLAGYFYLRSSRKLYSWLMTHPFLGTYLLSYERYRAVAPSAKAFAITLIWVTILLAIYFVPRTGLKIMLAVIASTVTLYILSLKSLTKEQAEELEAYRQQLLDERRKRRAA